MKMKKEFYAWAINTNSSEGHGFLGRYYYGKVPAHLEGCIVALFKTREAARQKVRESKIGYNPFPKIAISRVKVCVEELRQD